MSTALGLQDTSQSAGSSGQIPSGGSSVSAARVSAAIRVLLMDSRLDTQRAWLGAVARLVSDLRPDLGAQLIEYLDAAPLDLGSPLERMSIGEIGLVYEALMALTDHGSRRTLGQYFTPDDVASYMAAQALGFPKGKWLDPCCGVGNLAWHLTYSMPEPASFIVESLTLIDQDPVALRSAVVLLVACFAKLDDSSTLQKLDSRAHARDTLSSSPLPKHDFTIVNPPYAPTKRIDAFRTADARDLYAYFLERVATESKGFVAITPASYLSAKKFGKLREILDERSGGHVIVFDNVPDTCFRGYKYGSKNTSKTNFVRAAITVSSPNDLSWQVTPILRWTARSRNRMWEGASSLLVPRRIGPNGEWVKLMPGTESVWDAWGSCTSRLKDIVSKQPTEHVLYIASTPRYYISAAKRFLNRGSMHTLYFESPTEMDRAYVLLNSSLPYWWWRCLDGGITLPFRTLLSLPLPPDLETNRALVSRLEMSESFDVVTKLNAGRHNENVRRPRVLVDAIDAALLEGIEYDFTAVYASDMFDGARG